MTEVGQPTNPEPFQDNVIESQYKGFFGANTDTRLNLIDKFTIDKRNIRGEMGDSIDLPSNGVVLDTGCGNGSLLRDLRLRRGYDGTAIGLDIDESSLYWAQRIEAEIDMTPCIYIRGDMSKIPLADNSVDVVINSFAAHHAENPMDVINEAWRVLKPDGQFIVSANSVTQKEKHKKYLDAIAKYWSIKPPKPFAQRFNTQSAPDMLASLFELNDDDIVPQVSEMRFTAENYGFFLESLKTYMLGFKPAITIGAQWDLAVSNAVLPDIESEIETHGYLAENIDRVRIKCIKRAPIS